VKHQPIRTRLALWTAILLTLELVIFGFASGWIIYREQFEAFRELRGSGSPVAFRKEAGELIMDLANAYVLALPVAVLVAALGVWWISRRALQPLEQIIAAAEQISARSLDQRLPPAFVHDEIGRLTRVLNDLFNRLERSFAQAIRFSSDASHELKTPLTIMRGEIEAALRTDFDEGNRQKLLDGLLGQTQRLAGIAEKLLLLSRADAGALILKSDDLDFSAMCLELVEDARILALRREISVESEIAPGIRVYADEAYLRQVLLNLLDNATKYNLDGGRIAISLGNSDLRAFFRIANTGPAISQEHRTLIFERFYRTDTSRSATVVGSGLGLSICREIVLAHGGQIWLESTEPGWTMFAVTLPSNSRSLSEFP
jgi:signal transduction histidine kinase